MWNNDPDDHYVHPEEERKDLEEIEAFMVKATELKEKVDQLKAVLAKEFMEFSEARLSKYEYNSKINGAVYCFTNTSGLDEYNDKYDFWLPSNIGC